MSCDYEFDTRGFAIFSDVKDFSARYPNLVFSLAVVELGNGLAEAQVMVAGEVVGEYTMPDDERDQLAGPEFDDTSVLDGLFSTVAAYAEDALADLAAETAKPSLH